MLNRVGPEGCRRECYRVSRDENGRPRPAPRAVGHRADRVNLDMLTNVVGNLLRHQISRISTLRSKALGAVKGKTPDVPSSRRPVPGGVPDILREMREGHAEIFGHPGQLEKRGPAPGFDLLNRVPSGCRDSASRNDTRSTRLASCRRRLSSAFRDLPAKVAPRLVCDIARFDANAAGSRSFRTLRSALRRALA